MKRRSLLVVLVSVILVSGVTVMLALAYVANQVPPPQTPTPVPGWRVIPEAEQNAAGYVLVPVNGECEVHMPNGTQVVTVQQDCNVILGDCPVTVAGVELQSKCQSLTLDPTAISMKSSVATASAPMAVAPVNCSQPGYTVHTIQPGDTMWALAIQYQVEWGYLIAFNNMDRNRANHLTIGNHICVPPPGSGY